MPSTVTPLPRETCRLKALCAVGGLLSPRRFMGPLIADGLTSASGCSARMSTVWCPWPAADDDGSAAIDPTATLAHSKKARARNVGRVLPCADIKLRASAVGGGCMST